MSLQGECLDELKADVAGEDGIERSVAALVGFSACAIVSNDHPAISIFSVALLDACNE